MPLELGIGLVGGGWMGNVHSRAYARLFSLDPRSALRPRLVHVADAEPDVVSFLQLRWGWERGSADWRSVVDDPEVDLVDICAPNDLHCEIAAAAADAGKHVYCEKPLGRSVAETRRMAEAVRRAGVKSLVGYNYRWMPALQHARALVAEGRLGEITHFRSVFHTDWGASRDAPFSWRFDRDRSGWGALGDMASHVVDTAEALVGPIAGVTGTAATFVDRRPLVQRTRNAAERGASVFGAVEAGTAATWEPVTNEDYVAALVTFAAGARGTIEVSRAINGPRSRFTVELHGTSGSFSWDLERMNEYELWLEDDLQLERGYRRVLVGPEHPDQALFSPGAGVGIAFEDSKAIEVYRLLKALAEGRPPQPDFSVGLRVAEVLDCIAESFQSGSWVDVASRSMAGV
jgi:predicted dehydrogenase